MVAPSASLREHYAKHARLPFPISQAQALEMILEHVLKQAGLPVHAAARGIVRVDGRRRRGSNR
jgi:hypothetical protein